MKEESKSPIPSIIVSNEESKEDEAFFGTGANQSIEKELVDVFSAGPSQLP